MRPHCRLVTSGFSLQEQVLCTAIGHKAQGAFPKIIGSACEQSSDESTDQHAAMHQWFQHVSTIRGIVWMSRLGRLTHIKMPR